MSLINRVLQDLEARRVEPQGDAPVPEQVRAVTPAQPRSYRGLAAGLVGSLAVVGVIVFALSSNPQLIPKLKLFRSDESPAPPVTTIAAAPVEKPDVPGSVREQVEAALMMPVFQLSEELSVVPEARPRQSAVKAAKATNAGNVTTQSAVDAGKRVAASGQRPERKPDAMAVATVKSGEQGDAGGKTVVVAKPASQATSVSKSRVTAGTPASITPADEGIEEVVIPTDVDTGPIEKQARQLTSFERAENLFRLGVASLRRGHMSDAEMQFRAAIVEDRSHYAAQQALVGLLIDAGRLADAEEVLAESLSANPRQPKQAMVLARLQVERGDLGMATSTLENTRTYAGTDAVYLSFLAAVLQRAGRHEEAVVQYRYALAYVPRNAIWLMGISLRALGSAGEALQAFDEAAATGTLDPGLQAFVDQQRTQLSRAVN